MKVYLHYSEGWKDGHGYEQRIEGIYATRKAAEEKLPKNQNTTNRAHWIEAKTVKGIV